MDGGDIVATTTANAVNVFATTTGKTTLGGGAVDIGASGSATTVKGSFNVDEAATFDSISTTTLQIAGTSITATAAELNTYILNVALDNISEVTSCFVVAPKAGTITKITSIIDGTITENDAVITANVNGGQNNITETITIAFTNSNAGDIDSCTPTANNAVTAGQYIKLTSNGGSTTAVKAVFTIEITY